MTKIRIEVSPNQVQQKRTNIDHQSTIRRRCTQNSRHRKSLQLQDPLRFKEQRNGVRVTAGVRKRTSPAVRPSGNTQNAERTTVTASYLHHLAVMPIACKNVAKISASKLSIFETDIYIYRARS